jgi:hypothetical protein
VRSGVEGPGNGECEPLDMAMDNANSCCSWRGVGSPLVACSNAASEAVFLCGAIVRFVGETLAPGVEGDSTRCILVGISGNRVSSRLSMVLWEKATKARFCVRGFAGVTSCDLAFMADLDGDFGGDVEGRIRSFEGAQETFISCS